MSQPLAPEIVIFTAVSTEFAIVARAMTNGKPGGIPYGGDTFRTLSGKLGVWNAHLVQTGMGATKAAMLARITLAEHRPKHVVVLGFAGGLSPELRAGDLVVADAALMRTDDESEDEESYGSSGWAEIEEVLCHPPPVPIAGVRGKVWTRHRLAASVQEKKVLFDMSGAVSVDMESAGIARVCNQSGVPVSVLRAITDDFQTSFPTTAARMVNRVGNLQEMNVGTVLHMISFLEVGGMFRLWRDVRRASKSLEQAVTTLSRG